MKKIKMTEAAYTIIGDLTNVHRALDALRNITLVNSEDYISQKDYQTVMLILAKWSDAMHERVEIVDDK